MVAGNSLTRNTAIGQPLRSQPTESPERADPLSAYTRGMPVYEPGWEDRCARCGAAPAPWELFARDVRGTPDLPAVEDWEVLRFCERCWGDYQVWFNEAPDPDRPPSVASN